MDAQLSFASLDFASKKKRTKRDVFLAEMAAVVPWAVARQARSSTALRSCRARLLICGDSAPPLARMRARSIEQTTEYSWRPPQRRPT